MTQRKAEILVCHTGYARETPSGTVAHTAGDRVPVGDLQAADLNYFVKDGAKPPQPAAAVVHIDDALIPELPKDIARKDTVVFDGQLPEVLEQEMYVPGQKADRRSSTVKKHARLFRPLKKGE